MVISRASLALILPLAVVSIGAASSEVRRPFKLVDNLVFLPTTVDHHPGWGVIDTGTSGVAIDQAFARRAGIARGKSLGQADVSGTKPIVTWEARLRQLRMLDTILSNVSAIMLDMSAYTRSSGFPVDVLIGLPFFQHRIVSIDYPNSVLTIGPASPGRFECKAPIPFRLVDGTPVVDASASFDGGRSHQPLRLMIDLGTRHQPMLLGGSFLSTPAGGALKRAGAAKEVTSGAGGPVFGWSSAADTLIIGSQTYRHLSFAASADLNSSDHPLYDGTLGAPFWKAGVIRFDFDRQRLCLPDERHG